MKKAQLLVISISLLMSCVTVVALGRSEKGYNLEIYSDGKLFRSDGLYPKLPGLFVYSYSIFRPPQGQEAKTPKGERVYAFQIVPQLEGARVRVEVLALLEDPDTVSEAHPLHKFKKQSVAVYHIGADESITLSEMTRFGVRPLTLKVKQAGEWFE